MRPASAFTLLEILIVMALIGVLATLTFTLGEGIRERGKIGQAKVELAVLATALEAYKSRYGDYPQTGVSPTAGTDMASALGVDDVEARLFNALAGVLDPMMEILVDAGGNPTFGKVFIEGARFTFEAYDDAGGPLFPETAGTLVPNALLDPWGRRYQYYYRQAGSTTWTHPGYVLYSAGSDDGAHVPPNNTGDPQYAVDANRDNIYAGRN